MPREAMAQAPPPMQVPRGAAAAAIGAAERYKKKMKLKKRGALSTADLPGLSGIDLDSE